MGIEKGRGRAENSPKPVQAGEFKLRNHIVRQTIFIVEDEECVRELAKVVLEMHGYLVLTASDGQIALETAQSHDGPIHLLFADVMMPVSGGREVAEKLAEKYGDMKVLFTSGYPQETVIKRGYLCEESPFIAKPFTAVELIRKIRSILPPTANKNDQPV